MNDIIVSKDAELSTLASEIEKLKQHISDAADKSNLDAKTILMLNDKIEQLNETISKNKDDEIENLRLTEALVAWNENAQNQNQTIIVLFANIDKLNHDMQTQKDNYEAQISNLASEIKTLQIKMTAMTDQSNLDAIQISELENTINELKKNILDLTSLASHDTEVIGDLTKKISEFNERGDRERSECTSTVAQLQQENQRLLALLQDISDLTVNQQFEKISSTYINWQGENSQIDDVLLLGIRI